MYSELFELSLTPGFGLLFKNTVYEGEYNADHPIIQMFWEVFDELKENQKNTFLCEYEILFRKTQPEKLIVPKNYFSYENFKKK